MSGLLWLTLACVGCKEYPRLAKAGPLYVAADSPAPGNALIYVYWPPGERGKLSHFWVGPCDAASEEVERGTYTALVVEPGESCFEATMRSGLGSGTVMTQYLGRLELKTQPDSTVFLRVKQERGLLFSRVDLRPVAAAVAVSEITSCRQLVPLGPEETYRAYEQAGW